MVKRFTVFNTGLAFLVVLGCREKDATSDRVSRPSLAPVFSLGPASATNWDPTAGPAMLVALSDVGDSAAVVLPEATDSTIDGRSLPQISRAEFDLYGRSGKVGSSSAEPFTNYAGDSSCASWPTAHLRSAHAGWQVALTRGSARAIPLDSIEALSSADSAALAASLTESVATLPVASDPTFRRLPFRVRYAYTTRMDSVEIVVADIVRALNEEANPRIEHIFFVGERPRQTKNRFTVRYFSRTAGPEETAQATDLLAAVEIGSSRRPALVVNVESDNRARFGLIESGDSTTWKPVWWSAYTDC